MDVKGTAFLARESFVSREHGAAAFRAVVAKVAAAYPIFSAPIVATTLIPVRAFIAFNDAVVAALYGGDSQSYFHFGAESAVWGLTVGPYKWMVAQRSVRDFVATAATIYRSYFNEGAAAGTLIDDDTAEMRLTGIEPRHVYFEYAISGYFARGLELVSGRTVEIRRKRGFSRGDADVLYEMKLGPRP